MNKDLTPEQIALIKSLRLYSDREALSPVERMPEGFQHIPVPRAPPRLERPVIKLKPGEKMQDRVPELFPEDLGIGQGRG